jgi:hypothetical protein
VFVDIPTTQDDDHKALDLRRDVNVGAVCKARLSEERLGLWGDGAYFPNVPNTHPGPLACS